MTENKQEYEYEHKYVLLEKVHNYDGKADRDSEISLRELLFILIRGWKAIVLTALIALLLVTAVSLAIPHVKIGTNGELQTAVQLYFPEITEGNGPNGQKYDPNEIKSVEVLESAIATAGLENKHISLSQLRANIRFTSLLPDDVAQKMEILGNIKDEQVKLDRLENMQINSDAYIIKLNVSNRLGISMEEGRRLLDSIIYAYRDWLIKTYGLVPEMPNIFYSDINIEGYDYAQAVDILSRQLADMEAYVDASIGISKGKSSAAQTLQDIRDTLNGIRMVEIEGLYTKISAFHLTKDSQNTEATYRQMAEEQSKAATRNAEAAASLREIIAGYNGNEQKIILGDVGQTELTLKNESVQYNQFVSQYIAAKNAEAQAMEEAEYYKKQAERVANKKATIAADNQAAKEAEESIYAIKEELIYWTDEINRVSAVCLDDAMYQRYAEQIIPAKAYTQESGVNILMNMAIALVAGLMLGILLVLLREFLKNEE